MYTKIEAHLKKIISVNDFSIIAPFLKDIFLPEGVLLRGAVVREEELRAGVAAAEEGALRQDLLQQLEPRLVHGLGLAGQDHPAHGEAAHRGWRHQPHQLAVLPVEAGRGVDENNIAGARNIFVHTPAKVITDYNTVVTFIIDLFNFRYIRAALLIELSYFLLCSFESLGRVDFPEDFVFKYFILIKYVFVIRTD